MRTTLTLDDDVAIRLRKLRDEQGRSFKAVVNEALRAGLEAVDRRVPERSPYRITPHASGPCRLPNLDSLHEALVYSEGESYK